MKIYVLSIFMLISVGLSAQTGTKINSERSGDWDKNGGGWNNPTWNQDAPSSTNNIYDTIVIEDNDEVKLTGDVDLSGRVDANGNVKPIYLVVKGTLNMGGYSGFFTGAEYHLYLPTGSAISVRSSGTITGNSGSPIMGGSSQDDKIYIGTEVVYSASGGSVSDTYLRESGSNTDLPVELLSFDSEVNKKSINVYWQTASELDSDYFELERSADGENWEVLGRLAAAGNSNTLLDYSFIDQNPLMGDNYYRLHQVDFDGKDEYFGPIYQRYANEELNVQIRVYPNPNTDGQLTIKMNSNMMLGDVIEIYDVAGRLQKTITVSEEINTMQLNISDLKKGVYIIRYQNQEIQLTERLIIQ
jgi:hypothetical protein